EPALVDVGRGANDPVGHDAGVGDAELVGPPEFPDDVGDGLGDGVGSGRLRGFELEALADQLPGIEVDDAALDAAAADVNAESAALRAAVCAGVGGFIGGGHERYSQRRAGATRSTH